MNKNIIREVIIPEFVLHMYNMAKAHLFEHFFYLI